MSKIKFPTQLPQVFTIGITSPSSGVDAKWQPRLDKNIDSLLNQGFQIKEGKCLRSNEKLVSAPPRKRADELLNMLTDSSIDMIIPPWGGELLFEILPYIDFKKLKHWSPKWILGYSDTSLLLYLLTTISQWATGHGPNLMEIGAQNQDKLTKSWHKLLLPQGGKAVTQASSDKYQREWPEFYRPDASFKLTEKTKLKSIHHDKVSFEGVMVGGCLDVLFHVIGTPYDHLKEFKESFKDEGVILYLENCECAPANLNRALLQMKYAGWFDNLTGILIGRSSGPTPIHEHELTYTDVLEKIFDNHNIPVIYDMDIGHIPPQWTIINGAKGKVDYKDGKATLTTFYS